MRDPDFDWRIAVRGLSEDQVAETIERLEARLQEATMLLTLSDLGCDAVEEGDECPICEFLEGCQ